MWNLSDSQVALVVAGAGMVGGLIAWFGKGLSFLLHRRVTGAKAKEQVNYIKDVVDLSERMTAAGMTIEDARQFEALLRAPNANQGDAARAALGSLIDEPPTAFVNNMAMKLRADAACQVAQAKLRQVIVDLKLLLSEEEQTALDAAQVAWEAYLQSLEERSFVRFEGASHSTLAMMITGLSETERRTEELQAEVKERSSLYG